MRGPSGGMHVYVPFTGPIGFHGARELALALAARTPTMDPSPNQNLTDGLIRPPGSVHPAGGHQVLHGTLTDAHHLASTGNPPQVRTALTELLAAELAALQARDHQVIDPDPAGAGELPRPSGARELGADYQ